MPRQTNADAIRSAFEEGFNTGETGWMAELVSPSYELHGGPPGLDPGPAALNGLFAWARSACPNLTVSIIQQVEEGDKVGTEMYLRGTHEGDLLHGSYEGKPFSFQGTGGQMNLHALHLTHFKDGQIAEDWALYALIPALRELGILPGLEGEILPPPERPKEWDEPPGSLDENKALVRRLLEDGWGKGDLSVLEELVARDAIDNQPFPGEAPGREGIIHMLKALRTTLPDYYEKVADIVAQDDRVMVRRDVGGTFEKPYFQIPPTGEHVELPGMAIFRIRGGRVVERSGDFDILSLLHQARFLPPLSVKPIEAD
jgi:predicted ester cyclase